MFIFQVIAKKKEEQLQLAGPKAMAGTRTKEPGDDGAKVKPPQQAYRAFEMTGQGYKPRLEATAKETQEKLRETTKAESADLAALGFTTLGARNYHELPPTTTPTQRQVDVYQDAMAIQDAQITGFTQGSTLTPQPLATAFQNRGQELQTQERTNEATAYQQVATGLEAMQMGERIETTTKRLSDSDLRENKERAVVVLRDEGNKLVSKGEVNEAKPYFAVADQLERAKTREEIILGLQAFNRLDHQLFMQFAKDNWKELHQALNEVTLNDIDEINKLLERVSKKEISVEEAIEKILAILGIETEFEEGKAGGIPDVDEKPKEGKKK